MADMRDAGLTAAPIAAGTRDAVMPERDAVMPAGHAAMQVAEPPEALRQRPVADPVEPAADIAAVGMQAVDSAAAMQVAAAAMQVAALVAATVVAAATAAAVDTGKFCGFLQKGPSASAGGLFRWVEYEQILVEIRRACFKIALYQGTTGYPLGAVPKGRKTMGFSP